MRKYTYLGLMSHGWIILLVIIAGPPGFAAAMMPVVAPIQQAIDQMNNQMNVIANNTSIVSKSLFT
jgi:hypothetical protein